MDIQHYKQRLLALEQELRDRLAREVANARNPVDEQPDPGDQSVADESRDGSFTLATADAGVLRKIQEALSRIENGTFGQCVVDGGPIEEKRLEAVPWTPHCQKHQQQLEGAPHHTPTM